MSLINTAAAILCSVQAVAACQTKPCGEDDLTVIRRELSTSPDVNCGGPPFLTRRPDLEEDLIDLQFLYSGKTPGGPGEPGVPIPVHTIQIVDVSCQGNEIRDGRLVRGPIVLDGSPPTWRVALDHSSGKTFRLYGFPNSTAGFNDLLKTLGLKVGPREADLVVPTFAKLTLSTGGTDVVIRSRLDLLRMAIENFSGPGDEQGFMALWKTCPSGVKRQVAQPAVSTGERGPVVTFFADTDGAVRRMAVLVFGDGRVEVLESKPVYEWPDR